MSNGTTFRLDPTYFIGMDLHSNNVVVCVLQNAITDTQSLTRKIVKKAKIKLSTDLHELYEFLIPFCKDKPHQATVESTYNWYNVADLFEDNHWNLSLADPTTVKKRGFLKNPKKARCEPVFFHWSDIEECGVIELLQTTHPKPQYVAILS